MRLGVFARDRFLHVLGYHLAMQDFEKLGAFYLGRRYDPNAGKTQDDLLLYDSKDLVTHAVCFGMTGAGQPRHPLYLARGATTVPLSGRDN